jgi:NAD(P)-dependent dehydrogenase (short-subunit alcohol dehydrogenase family)
MLQDTTLTGRRAVVTGGGRGLGRAIADRLAGMGAHITVVDLPGAPEDLPAGWDGVALDLTAPDAQGALSAHAARLSPVSVVVANAGVVPPWRGVETLDRAEWDRVMAINVWGVAITLGAFAPALEASGHGSAIVMASINGYRAHPKQVLYSASKHAVIGVMRAAAQDLGPRGIRVNALAPGAIATDALLSRIDTRHAAGGPTREDALAGLAGETLLRRMATAEDVAGVAAFLASDASRGMTGHVFPVEAGLV